MKKKTKIDKKVDKLTGKKKVDKLIKGKKALLIAEACKLNKVKKDAEKRIKEIKKIVGWEEAGTYRNEAGDKVVISQSEKFSDIAPKDVLKYLKKHKLSKLFATLVKVQITPLKTIVPESEIDKWREELDPTIKYSWK